MNVWAALPVKSFAGAKQRLAALLSPAHRELLAEAMLEDVLSALVVSDRLSGIVVNTIEPRAVALARRYQARVVREDACSGHTAAVLGMARLLAREQSAMLAVPGDIPGVVPQEIDAVVAAALPAPSFTIVPAHDALGSNAVLCAPPDAVGLRFGDDSYFPHLAAARRAGIEPTIIPAPGIALDIDHPADLHAFLRTAPRPGNRTLALLASFGMWKGALLPAIADPR
jgi:2-phospho-L-lactate guanylyltransferase